MVVAAEVERWAIGYVDIVFLEYDDGHGQLCSAVADAYIISFLHVVAISSTQIYGVYVIRASFYLFIYKKTHGWTVDHFPDIKKMVGVLVILGSCT